MVPWERAGRAPISPMTCNRNVPQSCPAPLILSLPYSHPLDNAVIRCQTRGGKGMKLASQSLGYEGHLAYCGSSKSACLRLCLYLQPRQSQAPGTSVMHISPTPTTTPVCVPCCWLPPGCLRGGESAQVGKKHSQFFPGDQCYLPIVHSLRQSWATRCSHTFSTFPQRGSLQPKPLCDVGYKMGLCLCQQSHWHRPKAAQTHLLFVPVPQSQATTVNFLILPILVHITFKPSEC